VRSQLENYSVNLNASGQVRLIGVIETSFSDLFNLFGPARRVENGCASNEWRFVNSRGEVFAIYDGATPAEQINGPCTFRMAASSMRHGRKFALWLQDMLYAYRLTGDFKFVA